ncbi:MAG: DUF3298 and DUF4163 domain-containing protein [Candidatus Theseobacter exili]|nr:DUF3298 and DUF4163 domain-containing protein [Candidatus Theseobacter exili]
MPVFLRFCLVTIILAGFSVAAFADENFERGYFVGSITNDISVQMDLFVVSDTVTGSYYDSSKKLISSINGSIDKAGIATLNIINNEHISGRLCGDVNVSEGTFYAVWTNVTGKKSVPFQFIKKADYICKKANVGEIIESVIVYPYFMSSFYPFKKINGIIEEYMLTLQDEFLQNEKDAYFLEYRLIEYDMPGWSLHSECSIHFYSDELVSLLENVYAYTGGAHGNTNYSSWNYWIQEGDAVLIDLNALFLDKSDYVEVLAGFCLKDLKEQEAGWVTDGMVNSLDEINLKVFTISLAGISFYFAPYEMGCYAEGTYTVTIPYSELKDIIDLNGPLKTLVE